MGLRWNCENVVLHGKENCGRISLLFTMHAGRILLENGKLQNKKR
jgi:hypothetical protein